MSRTKTKSPRAGNKEKLELPPAEDSIHSPSKKKITQIKRLYECKTCGLQFDSRK